MRQRLARSRWGDAVLRAATAVAAAVLLMPCAVAGSLRVVPLTPDTRVFLAEATGNGIADICLLTGHELTIYNGSDPSAAPIVVTFAPGTTAFDIADVDGDGAPNLIAVQDEAIVRYSLRTDRPPVVLFERYNRLARTAAEPYPYVLVVDKEDVPTIALPGRDTFDLLTASGEVARRFPIGEDAPQRVEIGQPFRAWTTLTPQLGLPGTLEGFASHIVAVEPNLPADLVPIAREGQLYEGPPTPRPDAGGSGHLWPAFRVALEGEREIRARFALAGREQAETLVRIERLPLDDTGRAIRGAGTLGPERRYPGTALLSPTPPDFDGDGYADLALWDAPLPGRSVSSLTAAFTASSWPVRVRLHRFNTETGRFEARALAAISFGVPLEWFLFPGETGPIRLHTTGDFDNDGRVDFACATGPTEFTIWLSNNGFRAEAARVIRTGAPIEAVAFAEPLGEQRGATLALRTASALYILDP